jgi:hypothetical protein
MKACRPSTTCINGIRGFSTSSSRLGDLRTKHGVYNQIVPVEKRVVEVVLIAAVLAIMLKSPADPTRVQLEVSDGLRSNLMKNRWRRE